MIFVLPFHALVALLANVWLLKGMDDYKLILCFEIGIQKCVQFGCFINSPLIKVLKKTMNGRVPNVFTLKLLFSIILMYILERKQGYF